MILKRIKDKWDRWSRQDWNDNMTIIEKNFNNVVNVVSEQAYNQVVESATLIWKEPVNTFSGLVQTYPNPEVGWTVMAREIVTGFDGKGVNKVYRYNGSEWTEIQQILADAVNEVDYRLTSQLAQTDEKLIHISLDATAFGVTTDKIDVGPFLQEAIDFAHANNIPKILVPRNIYNLATSVFGRDDVVIDCQMSHFNSSINQDYIGAFNLQGGNVIGDELYLTTDLIDGAIAFNVDDASSLVAGDFIFIRQTEPTTSATASDHEKRFTSQMLEIGDVSGNVITLTEPVVNSYFVSAYAKIQKIIPLKNAGIENLTVDHLGTNKSVHSVYMHTTSNCYVENVKSYNSAGMGVQVIRSRHFEVSGIKAFSRTDTSAGKGYTLSVGSSSYGNIDNIRGQATRHTVDIASGSHSINVDSCFGLADTTASFGVHGQNVRKTTFSNCHVIGSAEGYHVGSASFRSDSEITFVNCKATKCNIGFLVGEYSSDIIFSACITQKCVSGFNLTKANKTTIDACMSDTSSSVGVWINNSTNINISNITLSGDNGRGFEVTGSSNGVNIGILRVLGNYTIHPVLINSSKFVNILSLSINATATTQSLFNVLNGTSTVNITNFDLRGSATLHAIYVSTDCSIVDFRDGTIDVVTGSDTIRFGSNLVDTTNNIKLQNIRAKINSITADTKVLRALCNKLSIQDCNLNGGIISAGENDAIITDNRFTGDLNIRTVAKLIFTQNIGDVTISMLPEHNGTTIINQNNLLSVT